MERAEVEEIGPKSERGGSEAIESTAGAILGGNLSALSTMYRHSLQVAQVQSCTMQRRRATRSGDPLDLGERDRRAVKPKARREEGWASSFPRNPRKRWSTGSETVTREKPFALSTIVWNIGESSEL
ncbi:hypothetical protein K0M31_012008 [Melipona bicolor]|uniref:Uncharacterized protein n=1 Tax=Melipona bicolor TaxID=60889 RepID=A0AA40KVA6_9HYME|nr:hypothetical protein K0M31_012008 [Melipona bicolor]